jgi:hypothetical protein
LLFFFFLPIPSHHLTRVKFKVEKNIFILFFLANQFELFFLLFFLSRKKF